MVGGPRRQGLITRRGEGSSSPDNGSAPRLAARVGLVPGRCPIIIIIIVAGGGTAGMSQV